jgi:hypothetical protein
MKKQLAANPVLHVLVLGALLGLVWVIAKGPPTAGDEAKRVVITAGDVLQLKAGFMRTWQREPTRVELRGAVDSHIREEVLYREALARGYDRDDPVVRRAMQRKMEFLADAQGLREPPSDDEIEAYFALRRERYRTPAVISLLQVYVSEDARGDVAERDAQAILEELRRDDPEPSRLDDRGDPLMLPGYLAEQTEQEIRGQFGDVFADAVVALEPGSWQGPIRSGYGLHLVKVLRRQESSIPEIAAVRSRVVTDMEYEARTAAREQLYQEIAQGYQLLLDPEVRELLGPGDG